MVATVEPPHVPGRHRHFTFGDVICAAQSIVYQGFATRKPPQLLDAMQNRIDVGEQIGTCISSTNAQVFVPAAFLHPSALSG
jgi:hypothetical protein